MRHIEKPRESEAPEAFKAWKLRHPNSKYYRFKDARIKRIVKNSLIVRQKYLCCYCESRITDETSHIEHIEPQRGGLSHRTMDYANMAVSCIKDPKKFESQNEGGGLGVLRDSYLHCGHARGTLPAASPYDPRCSRLFAYSFSGEIRVNPALTDAGEIELARESIDNLRLNVPPLVNLRKIAMFETLRLLEAGVPPSEILREINGRCPPFVSSATAAADSWKLSRKSEIDTYNEK